MGGTAHGVAGDGDAAVGAVLEADRQFQATDHFAVDLRLGGARANRGPGQKVIEVAGGHWLQQFGGDRQAAFDHVQHQPAGQRDAGVHVVAAIEVRVVGQAFPADRGAGFFDVGAHHQQQLVVDFAAEGCQAVGVFQGRARVVDRARANDHQQALVAAFEDVANGLAVGMDLLGKFAGQRHLLLEQVRAGQALADGGVGCLRLGQGEAGGVHGVFSLGGRRVLARVVGPIEVFDKSLNSYWLLHCHLWKTERRRQAGPNGIG